MLSELSVKNYEEAERYLLEIPKFTSKNPLEATRDFYQYLFSYALKGKSFENKVIHIAGTNGKGSVCAYLNSILEQGGMRVGMFTSPHLVTMRERFKIAGENVSEALFLEALVWVREQLNKYREEKQISYEPTFFEMLFFMGFYLFTREAVDIILLETGLGGKLDATNVTSKPLLTIITEIGLDHMQYLGNTLSRIAGEKAGIIKHGVPVVYGMHNEEKKEATAVIAEKAHSLEAVTYCIQKDDIKGVNIGEKSIDFLVKSRYYDYIRLTVATSALYQIENAALAIRATDALQDIWKQRKTQNQISLDMIQQGVLKMKWEARMEEIMPDVYLDGGHNQDGVKAFLDTVTARQQFHKEEDRNILLFSAVNDKAYEEMIRMIAESDLFDEIYLTSIPGMRGTAVEELRDTFKQYTDQQIQIFKDVKQAWKECLASKGDKDTVYVAGSLYLAGLIKELL